MRCRQNDCRYYDQSHSLLCGGLVHGLTMRNLTVGLSESYVDDDDEYFDSPIDNIYAHGPIFDRTTKMLLERGAHFGSDHYAFKVRVE